MKELKELKCGRWIPEYAMVRTEDGWVLPKELTKKERLLTYDDEEVIGQYPRSYYKVYYDGILLSHNNIKFKPSDLNHLDEWLEVKTILKNEILELEKIQYKGFLYSFDFTPIISYDYKVSKINSNNLLKVNYIL